jgi:NAD(P)-dependent dehydrogenase (short-subunit alcohol dehydrogenase family)
MQKLDGKSVVITGAASGLGRSLALALAARGCRIGVADVNREGAEETLGLVIGRGGSGEAYQVDMTRPEEVEAMAGHFFQSWGGVDLLINNAGVIVVGPVSGVLLEDWEWVMGTNFWGMLYGCRSFIPRMKALGGGHILNVASSAGLLNTPDMAPYNVSKAAVISLSETLKTELAPSHIGVTVLCPMVFDTNLLETMRHAADPETDEFVAAFWRPAFANARMSADRVAEAAITAVEKGRLYCVPQPTGKFHWSQKRIMPSFYYGLFAWMNKLGWLQPLEKWMARNGLV